MLNSGTAESIDWSRSARQDMSIWLLLVVGVAFMWCGFMVDPLNNCNTDGECAPWLVPLAAILGFGAVVIATGTLLANPGRGCRFDGEILPWPCEPWPNRLAARWPHIRIEDVRGR